MENDSKVIIYIFSGITIIIPIIIIIYSLYKCPNLYILNNDNDNENDNENENENEK